MRTWVKVLVGILLGLFIASHVGVGVGTYLAAWGVTLAAGLVLAVVPMILVKLRSSPDASMYRIATSVMFAVSLAVDRHFGFTLAQIITLSCYAAGASFVLELLLPDRAG